MSTVSQRKGTARRNHRRVISDDNEDLTSTTSLSPDSFYVDDPPSTPPRRAPDSVSVTTQEDEAQPDTLSDVVDPPSSIPAASGLPDQEEEPHLTVEADELFPARYNKRVSSTGKVAYVIFHGVCPGLYYNWETCHESLQLVPKEARRFKGYTSFQDARTAWTLFVNEGIYPAGFLPPSAKSINDIAFVQEAADNMLLQARARRRAPQTQDPSISATNPRPSAFPPPFPTPPGSVGLPGHPWGQNGVYIVLEGPRPGVYGQESLARSALGSPTNKNWLIAAGPEQAFEIFAQMYMMGRIIRTT